MFQDVLILSIENIINFWVVNSGDSFHATPHRNHFHDYVQGDFGQVYLGHDKPLDIIGKRKVFVKSENGNQWFLKDVKPPLGLRKNLI